MRSSLIKRLLAGTTATSVALAPLASRANPLGGQVVGGTASIQGQGSAALTVTQSTSRAIIDWRTFNIAPGETTQFFQPNASAVTLNRVTGGLGVSTIDGTIKANGGVYIVNPDGLLFGPSAKVNVGSFLGTTHDVANGDFMGGSNAFTISGNPSASIVNQGTITAAKGGFAALVAPGVRNDGVITANLGTVALASGNAFTLDLYGDSLIKLQPGDAIAGSVRDAATGQTLTSLVSNTGTLKANGGKVMLTAVAAKQVVDSVINSSGVIEANTVGTKNGLVVFGAATAASKTVGAPVQTVKVSGKLRTAGRKPGTTGGKIQITGENIVLTSAKLDASGQAGGGTIVIGGDFKGGDPSAPAVTRYGQSFEASPIPNASTTSVDTTTTLNASALASGNGGKVVVWSNIYTAFAGSILATGGKNGGNGGFIETSGQGLSIAGASVSTAAPKGTAGHWLLDPDDFTVDASNAGVINSALTTGDVIIATTASATGGNGDIFINAPIAWSTNSGLTLDAYRGVIVNSNIMATGVTPAFILYTNDGGTGGAFTTAPGASVSLTPGSALAINSQVYKLISAASNFQAIGLTGSYALATDINLSGLFSPIGQYGTNIGTFSGTLEGLGHNVNGLIVNTPNAVNGTNAGLFGSVGGNVENLNIAQGSVTLNSSGTAGLLAGSASGNIYNVSVSGQVNALLPATEEYQYVGGLLGVSSGSVTYSRSSAVVTQTGNTPESFIGGFVGDVQGGQVNYSYATGNVSVVHTGLTPFTTIGGFAGENDGVPGINHSYASGNIYYQTSNSSVVQIGDDSDLGTFVGYNSYHNATAALPTGDGFGLVQTNCSRCFQGVVPFGMFTAEPSVVATVSSYLPVSTGSGDTSGGGTTQPTQPVSPPNNPGNPIVTPSTTIIDGGQVLVVPPGTLGSVIASLYNPGSLIPPGQIGNRLATIFTQSNAQSSQSVFSEIGQTVVDALLEESKSSGYIKLIYNASRFDFDFIQSDIAALPKSPAQVLLDNIILIELIEGKEQAEKSLEALPPQVSNLTSGVPADVAKMEQEIDRVKDIIRKIASAR